MATAQVTRERPGSPEEAAELLRSLGEAGRAVRPVGGRTKLDWGGIGEPIAVELETAGMAKILDACLDAGGSITGEHGVGVDKKKHMPKMFDEPDLATFQRLRCAFDPEGLANPTKVMPTPRLCGEVPGPYRVHPLEAAGLAERF